MVEIPSWLVIDVLSLAFTGMLLLVYRIRIAARIPQKRLIQSLLLYLAVLFASHMLGQLAVPGNVTPGVVGNLVALSLDVGILLFWQAYCEVWAGMDEGGVLRQGATPWLWAQRLFVAGNVALNLVGLPRGWFFSFDAAGAYHRGPLFLPHVGATVAFALLVEAYIVRHRRQMPASAVPWLAAFPAAPFLGGILQLAFAGLPLEFAGALLSASLLHVFVQERDSNTDFLTGVANRRQLDIVLDARARRVGAGGTLSALMVDVDRFKQINDTYGHNQGDAALVEVAKLLVRTSGPRDVVARYGGDEFFVVGDVADEARLAEVVARMREGLERLNRGGRLAFPVGMSVGAGVFDPALDGDLAGFRRRLDERLYEEKRRKADERAAAPASEVACVPREGEVSRDV